jgi:hypothetical protein
MGTRSTVKIYNEKTDEKPMVCIYRQYDGYISGRGHELAQFLSEITLVNGFGRDTNNIANGMGCLAAQWIAQEKEGVGNVYITYLEDSEEYNYEVRFSGEVYIPKEGDTFEITVISYGEQIFKGTPEELLKFRESV